MVVAGSLLNNNRVDVPALGARFKGSRSLPKTNTARYYDHCGLSPLINRPYQRVGRVQKELTSLLSAPNPILHTVTRCHRGSLDPK
jgi:hypothetical protein